MFKPFEWVYNWVTCVFSLALTWLNIYILWICLLHCCIAKKLVLIEHLSLFSQKNQNFFVIPESGWEYHNDHTHQSELEVPSSSHFTELHPATYYYNTDVEPYHPALDSGLGTFVPVVTPQVSPHSITTRWLVWIFPIQEGQCSAVWSFTSSNAHDLITH